jgi:chromosomal replication initiation ATPase DnaA
VTAVRDVNKALAITFLNVGGNVLGTRCKKQEFAWARQVGMVALVDQYGLNLTQAAQAVGYTHGTVHHAVKRVRDAVQLEPWSQRQVQRFLKVLGEVRRES